MLNGRRLAELQALLGENYPTFLQQVLHDMDGPLAHLCAARTSGDTDGILHALHALRGVASNIGCDDLTALCAQAEQVLRNGTLPEACLAAIHAAVDRCRTILQQEMTSATR